MKKDFDILVVGAGPAGIAAAIAAAENGLRVGVVDDSPSPGGQIWRRGTQPPTAARRWNDRFEAAAVVRMMGWRVIDCLRLTPEGGILRAECNTPGVQPADLHFRHLILATGARERFLPFPGWTLPNVMGAGGLDAMVRGGLPIEGKRVVIAGTGPLLLAVAAQLTAHGASVVAICEQASLAQMAPLALALLRQPGKLLQGAKYRWATRKTPFFTRCWPAAALAEPNPGPGSENEPQPRLQAVTLHREGKQWTVACDYLACGFHLVPNTELASLLGSRIQDGFVVTDQQMRTSIPAVWCAGEPTGIGGVDASLLEGRIAGLSAAGKTEAARALSKRRPGMQAFARALERACRLDPRLRELADDQTIVCRCEDVRMAALRGRYGWRDAKLHTRCGMGPCQGRVCGGAAEFLFGWSAGHAHPPLYPARVSSLMEEAEEEAMAASSSHPAIEPE
jgi:NADPH-dependent 2,4-dienoyl-CoA reductase/sulfur reductase-like enzyme